MFDVIAKPHYTSAPELPLSLAGFQICLLTAVYVRTYSGRAQPANSVGLVKLTFCKWLFEIGMRAYSGSSMNS